MAEPATSATARVTAGGRGRCSGCSSSATAGRSGTRSTASHQDTTGGTWTKQLKVAEAAGVDDAPLLELWRFLLAIDWMDTIEAFWLAVDHPLVLSLDAGQRAQR